MIIYNVLQHYYDLQCIPELQLRNALEIFANVTTG